jgi:cobalt-zinc-cadmium efflux system membrane fusion protein
MKITYFICGLMLFVACRNSQKTEKEPVKKEENTFIVELNENEFHNAKIQTDVPQKKALNAVLKVNGFTDVPPQNLISISAVMGGYLKYTHLIPGMHIRKGEKLATLEDSKFVVLQENYLTAKVKLAQLEKELARQTELNQSKTTSDKALEQVKSEYLTQKIMVQSLGEQLKLLNINPEQLAENNISREVYLYAPAKGYVTKVNVNIGRYVQPSEVLFELVDPTDIHIKLAIFEKDIDKIYIGQKFTAYTNKDNKEYSCDIVFIGKELNKDRSLDVHCHCQNLDKNIIPGEYITAEIPVKTVQSGIVLSEDAIVRFEGREYIFIEIGKYKYEMTEVQTGIRQNGFTEVKMNEKLNENSSLVVKGVYNLLMKLKNTEEE